MATAVERETQAIKSEARKILLIVLVLSLVVYSFTGTAQIGQQETGLIIRLGQVIAKRGPGLQWGFPWPIDKVVRIPTGVAHSLEVRNFNLDPQEVQARIKKLDENQRFKALRGPTLAGLVNPYLITGDLNVIHLDLRVIYNITEPEDYYLAAGDVGDVSQTNVQTIAGKIVANAVIQAVAEMEVMNVLGEGKADIQRRVRDIARQQFEELALGIDIRQSDAVQITLCDVPAAVKPAFERVTTARQEKDNQYQMAQLEHNQILRQAEADASQIVSEARTCSQATVSRASGQAKRFEALIKEYQNKGEVVRDRLRNEKLAELAPYLKAPTVDTIGQADGKRKLVITIPANPE